MTIRRLLLWAFLIIGFATVPAVMSDIGQFAVGTAIDFGKGVWQSIGGAVDGAKSHT